MWGSNCTTAEPPAPPDDWWPCYFAARDIEARNFTLKAGELFFVQRKDVVRNYLRGFVPNIDTMPLDKVKLLKTLRVPPKAYAEIIEKNANYEQAREILKRRTRG
jgi:hypothetical protein